MLRLSNNIIYMMLRILTFGKEFKVCEFLYKDGVSDMRSKRLLFFFQTQQPTLLLTSF